MGTTRTGSGSGSGVGWGHEGADETPMLSAAREYTRRGWRVVPVRPREKGVTLSGWQQLRLEMDDLPKWFQGAAAHNVGILTGAPSGGLVDVDCDAPEAREAAKELLPNTGLISGRFSNPASHYWYQIEGDGPVPATAKFGDVAETLSRPSATLPDAGRDRATIVPTGDGSGSPPSLGEGLGEKAEADHSRAMLVELRSTGCQTIAPPSVHPSGEGVRFERETLGIYGKPGVVSGAELLRAVTKVAAVALLARHWPAVGERDEAAKDLAGLLVRGGWAEEEVDSFTQLTARIAGDEEWRQRGKARGTARKLAEGGEVTGGPSLAARLTGDGERVVARVRVWLGLKGLGSAYIPTTPLSSHQNAISVHSPGMSTYGDDDQVWRRWSVAAADVERTAVHWLWQGRIPLGAITLLDGDPGLGKSLITLDLAARVTRGRIMPDGSPGVEGGAGVVLLSAEDDLSATILPRLDAAAADTERVEFLHGAQAYDKTTGHEVRRLFVLPVDIPWLEEAIQEKAAQLVVIDPLMAFLDSKVNSWRDQDVRATLAPLAAVAERTGAAILILRHLNKASGMSAIQRGGGSIGIIGAARSGLLVAKHPDDPDHEQVLASTKSNLGPPMPSLGYRIRPLPIGLKTLQDEGTEYLMDVPVVEWLGECDLNAAQLLAASQVAKEEVNPSKVAEAEQWLRAALADGLRSWETLDGEARATGIKSQTLVRARVNLKLVKQRVGFGGHVFWSLPPKAAADAPAPYVVNGSIRGHPETATTYGEDEQVWENSEDGADGDEPDEQGAQG